MAITVRWRLVMAGVNPARRQSDGKGTRSFNNRNPLWFLLILAQSVVGTGKKTIFGIGKGRSLARLYLKKQRMVGGHGG